MKKHFKILWGFVTVVMIALSFAACNFVLKNDPSGNGGSGDNGSGGNNGGQTAYSIVGTWKRSFVSEGTTITIIFTLNANNKGSYVYSEGEYTTQYNLAYNFDPNTNTGTSVMTDPIYGQTFEQQFRVTWYGANSITISILDKEYGYADEWETLGLFERQ